MGECKLLGGWYAICLQLFIGLSALVSLLYKREFMDPEPKRPYLIWVMDVSKQAIAESTLHVYNVAFGIIIDNLDKDTNNDQCAFYLMNEWLDTVVGTLFVWGFTLGFEAIGRHYKVKEIEKTGFYGDQPDVHYYLLQLLTFMISNLVGKTLVTMLCLLDPRGVESVGSFIFNELGVSPEVELTLVMAVLPLLMTIAQMWIVDQFLGFDTEAEVRQSYNYRQLQDDALEDAPPTHILNSTHGLPPIVFSPRDPFSGTKNGNSSSSSEDRMRGTSLERFRSEL